MTQNQGKTPFWFHKSGMSHLGKKSLKLIQFNEIILNTHNWENIVKFFYPCTVRWYCFSFGKYESDINIQKAVIN